MADEEPPIIVQGLADAPEVFVDGFHGVSVANGVVKVNFYSMLGQPTPKDAKCVVRVSMSVGTFVQVRDVFSELIESFNRDGVLTVDQAERAND